MTNEVKSIDRSLKKADDIMDYVYNLISCAASGPEKGLSDEDRDTYGR